MDFHNATASGAPVVERAPDAPCLDSAQAWFCRDLWVQAAAEGERARAKIETSQPVAKHERRAEPPMPVPEEAPPPADAPPAAARADDDEDADAGADYDAMPDADPPPASAPGGGGAGFVPNSRFDTARILVNPRCVTTYAGVSHTQLAFDLFGEDLMGEPDTATIAQYRLDSWQSAPESFVCQEQKFVARPYSHGHGADGVSQDGGRKESDEDPAALGLLRGGRVASPRSVVGMAIAVLS
jgi:hypothetical protein